VDFEFINLMIINWAFVTSKSRNTISHYTSYIAGTRIIYVLTDWWAGFPGKPALLVPLLRVIHHCRSFLHAKSHHWCDYWQLQRLEEEGTFTIEIVALLQWTLNMLRLHCLWEIIADKLVIILSFILDC